MKKNEILLNKWEKSCNEIVEAFLKKHGYYDKENKQVSCWDWIVSNEVGGVVECADDFFSFDDIITDLRQDAPKKAILNYKKYLDDWQFIDQKINYLHYLMGARYEQNPLNILKKEIYKEEQRQKQEANKTLKKIWENGKEELEKYLN